MSDSQGVFPVVENGIFAQFARVEAYWQALRPADGGLPKRSSFNPKGIADCLSSILLLERMTPSIHRIRVAGMEVCELMGMEMRGMPLSALIAPESRMPFAEAMTRVFEEPARVELCLTADKHLGRSPVKARLLVLPMLGPEGGVDRALAYLAVEGVPTSRPQRFHLQNVSMRSIVVGRRPVLKEAPSSQAWHPVVGMAEKAAPFTPALKSERPWLRLVKTDETA